MACKVHLWQAVVLLERTEVSVLYVKVHRRGPTIAAF